LNSWLPTVLHDSGVPLDRAIRITAMFQVGGAVGAYLLGRVFDRKRSFGALALAYFGASVCVFFIGMAVASIALQALAVFAGVFWAAAVPPLIAVVAALILNQRGLNQHGSAARSAPPVF